MARDLGYPAEEGKISVDEWRDGCASGAITEVFACGTAAVVTPSGTVKGDSLPNGSFTVGDGSAGPVTAALKDRLVGIQTGQRPDTHGWMHKLT